MTDIRAKRLAKLTAKLQRRQGLSPYLYYTAIRPERDYMVSQGWEQVGVEAVLYNGNSLYQKYQLRIANPALTTAA